MTGAAPAWVSYLALAISGFALLVSYLSYRASGPRIRLKVQYELKDPVNQRAVMAFTVVNKSLAQLTVRQPTATTLSAARDLVEDDRSSSSAWTLSATGI
jgi:hypothetical protein